MIAIFSNFQKKPDLVQYPGKWDYIEEEIKKSKKRQLAIRNGTLQNLIDELKRVVGLHAPHVFMWHWQAKKQSLEALNNLHDKWVLSVWDFAENYHGYFQPG